jgi:hypothetical protein
MLSGMFNFRVIIGLIWVINEGKHMYNIRFRNSLLPGIWVCIKRCGNKYKLKSAAPRILSTYGTAWTREIVARGGHPLGLIEYMIEIVYQVFCHLNYTNFAFLGICINSKGCPPLTFINPKVLRGCPPLTFQKSKGWAPQKNHWVDEKWEVGTPQKTFGLMKS